MHALMNVRRLVVHHSASSRETTIDMIREWHQDRGFEDVGYHWVIEGDGTIRAGRRPTIQGAHARGANGDSWGVCVVGDNTKPGREWNEAQIASLRRVVEACRALVPGIEVIGHRDVPGGTKTECPGLDVRALLEE